jgi:hypothetical protein
MGHPGIKNAQLDSQEHNVRNYHHPDEVGHSNDTILPFIPGIPDDHQ